MVNYTLTQTLKKIIKEKGLYNTGALYNSVSVELEISNDTVTVNVFVNDYFKFLDENYVLTETFTSTPEFTEEVTYAFQDFIISKLDETIDSGKELVIDPKVFVEYFYLA